MNRQRLILALACALLALLLSAPAPGSVSGCSVESVPADPVEFCEEKGRAECRRMHQREELDDAGLAACVAGVPVSCAGANWELGCAPTNMETGACISALLNLRNINTPFASIPQCRDLCR